MQKLSHLLLILLCELQFACGQQPHPNSQVVRPILTENESAKEIVLGASRVPLYLPLLNGQRVGVVANQTSTIGAVHVVDSLLQLGVNVRKVFAPEHGFRGDAGAGETILNGKDPKTGLSVLSLYGKTKKPTAEMLQDLDVLIFDIQDVGARFYTYLSTLHYVMEACAEQGKKLIVLDRPNPNGFYVDGPVLKPAFQSFVGMHPIPVVHGCTLGELAAMINGEGWLKGGVKCDVTVVPCFNYSRDMLYHLPIKPSPNLPNMSSVYLYPSLCFFEGTKVSVGRGTDHPFQIIGYPGNKTGTFAFIPKDVPHVAMNPPHEGQSCTGHDLAEFGQYHFQTSKQLYLHWLLGLYQASDSKSTFFTEPAFFDKLAGTDELRKQIEQGLSEDQIRASWQKDLEVYMQMRSKYLLYPNK